MRFAIVFYTTSQVAHAGVRRPRHHIVVDEGKARMLGQRGTFLIDVTRIARLPLSKAYFPTLAQHTVAVLGHDPRLVAAVERRLTELMAEGLIVHKVDHVPPSNRQDA